MNIKEIFAQARNENRTLLYELESKEILSAYDIPVAKGYLAKSAIEAADLASKFDGPVALKICSPEITHKSDAGGVKLNILGQKEVMKAYNDIIEGAHNYNPAANILGVVVQPMVKPDREVIVGAVKDPAFGPVLMFGLGGIFVEVLKDVSFRLIPLKSKDAKEMIEEIKGYPLLAGIRGKAPCNVEMIVDTLLKVSALVEEHQDDIAEIDINPMFVSPAGVIAVDARIILERN